MATFKPRFFDNMGTSADRYTLILDNGERIACSANPSGPLGIVSRFSAVKTMEQYLNAVAYELDEVCIWGKTVKPKEISFAELPKAVQDFINDEMEEYDAERESEEEEGIAMLSHLE